ncbi:MAG: transketolase [Microgenomates group bacterium]
MKDIKIFQTIAQRVRYNIVTATTAAGSGHPSSSLSAVELTSVLFFGGFFKQDTKDFGSLLNDKFILSKGHAAPLLYSLYEAAGVITKEELLSLRKFESHLQGHPTPEFPFVDVTTGSLGQGLSVGTGMALGLKLKGKSLKFQAPNVFVLLGDSEFAEGQNYEALQLASHYKLNNLIAILDVNRLGQRGETQLGWDTEAYKKRAEAFGWNVILVENGNNIEDVQNAFLKLRSQQNEQPTIIIAKTKKGAGISFMEDKDNWHGKPIPQGQLEQALKDIGEVDFSIHGVITKPDSVSAHFPASALSQLENPRVSGIPLGLSHLVSSISTREAYGHMLAELAKQNKDIIALDAETSNSTYAEFVKKETPEQFIECFIAEQNMISMALGLSKVGFIPFASSFAAFLSRAFDQIRMSQYSRPNINIVGSHAGCSIGVDGASQMALEDISMMRSVRESTVLYPSDSVSTYKLTQEMVNHPGINYLRTTREKTPVLYDEKEEFPIGGLKIHHCHSHKHEDGITYPMIIISAGITLHEALKAQKTLEEKLIHTIVIDLYSIKPLDSKKLVELASKTKHLIVVEDHYESGGIGEAVLSACSLQLSAKFTHLCVRKEPRSGTPEELMRYEEIDAEAIVKTIVG